MGKAGCVGQMSAWTTETPRTPALGWWVLCSQRVTCWKGEVEGSLRLTLPRASFRVLTWYLRCPPVSHFYLRYGALAPQAWLPKTCQTKMNVHVWIARVQQIRHGPSDPASSGTTHVMLCRSTGIFCGSCTVTQGTSGSFPTASTDLLKSPVPSPALAAGLRWRAAFPTPWHLLLTWTCQSHGQIFRNIKCHPDNVP